MPNNKVPVNIVSLVTMIMINQSLKTGEPIVLRNTEQQIYPYNNGFNYYDGLNPPGWVPSLEEAERVCRESYIEKYKNAIVWQ